MQAKQVPLSRLLFEGREQLKAVAVLNAKKILWHQFVGDVSSQVEKINSFGTGRWLLYVEDSYLFSVSLFALWHSGSIAVLPPNSGKQTLEELNNEIIGIITDQKIDIQNTAIISPSSVPPNQETITWRVLDRDQVILEIFTSGSTGARKALKKTLSHLESEVEQQEKVWGHLIADADIFSTVSHHHIYGLLFKILWPLHAGRAFFNETIFAPNQLISKMSNTKKACLVTGPAHLKRIPELVDLHELGSKCKIIFSSGGPLSKDTSLTYTHVAKLTPYEILGSTETGGIAWRQQKEAQQIDYWCPFKSVEVELQLPENFLKVRSPFFSETNNEGWFVTGDLAEIYTDHYFLLKGRGDRVVKIEEKRLSLSEMEQRLEAHEWIEKAKVFLQEDPPFSKRRPPLAAIIVLKNAGKSNLKIQKKHLMTRLLKQYLTESFNEVLMPRSWKFINNFPEDAQGKTSLADLRNIMQK